MSLISDMGRCGQCPPCVVVFEFGTRNKKNRKKNKKFEYASPCVDPTATNSKRKISEVEALQPVFAAGHGGKIQGELEMFQCLLQTEAASIVQLGKDGPAVVCWRSLLLTMASTTSAQILFVSARRP